MTFIIIFFLSVDDSCWWGLPQFNSIVSIVVIVALHNFLHFFYFLDLISSFFVYVVVVTLPPYVWVFWMQRENSRLGAKWVLIQVLFVTECFETILYQNSIFYFINIFLIIYQSSREILNKVWKVMKKIPPF